MEYRLWSAANLTLTGEGVMMYMKGIRLRMILASLLTAFGVLALTWVFSGETGSNEIAKGSSTGTKVGVESPVQQFPTSMKFVQLLDYNHWLISDNRGLYKTEDAGRTWKQIYSVPPEADLGPHIMGLSFVDSQTGFVIRDKQLIRTNDGGASWDDLGAIQAGPEVSFFLNCYFVDSLSGWVVGGVFNEGAVQNPNISFYEGAVFVTKDGGRSWQRQRLNLPKNYHQQASRWALKAIYFRNAETGWVVGDGVIFWTVDGGQTWHPSNARRRTYIDVAFLDDQLGWVTQKESAYFSITYDGGQNWKERSGPPSPPGAVGVDVIFLSPKNGFAALDGLYETKDGGQSWQRQITNNSIEEIFSFVGRARDGTLVTIRLDKGAMSARVSSNNGITWHVADQSNRK